MQAGAVWWTVVVVVLAAASVRSEPVDLTPFCTDQDDGYYCATCMHSVYCEAGVTYIIETCLVGEVCDEEGGYAPCVAIEKAAKCQCDEYSQCDDYNPIYVNKCDEHGIYDVFACDDDNTCNAGTCGAEVPGVNTCEDEGALIGEWNFINPDCSQGFYCYETGSEYRVECDANEYIDINGDCLPAPPKPCDSGCTGICPDNLDCTRYYYCENGIVTDITECPENSFFNPNGVPVPKCEEGDDTVCPPLTFCEFNDAIITTTTTKATPTTTITTTLPVCTADTVGNYPYGPCSSYYWACRNIGDENYQAVLSECSEGLIFDTDPTLPYCVLPENEATCNDDAADSSFLLQ